MEEWRNWTVEELERQMSPSRWTLDKSKTGDEVINEFIAECSSETQEVRTKIPNKLNISYGSLPTQKFDLYGTDLKDNAPIFFFIHGGYWQEGSKDISATMVQNLHSIGVKTLILGYSLTPEVTIFQIKTEFFSALQDAMKRFDHAKFIIGGHSAGGQLTAMLLHDESRDLKNMNLFEKVAGLVLYAGVFDLRPLVPTYINKPLNLTEADAEKLSPLLLPFNSIFSPQSEIPILLCIGQQESKEFRRQSMDYTSKLQQTFTKCRIQLWMPHIDDHFSIIRRLSESSETSPGKRLVDFVKSISV